MSTESKKQRKNHNNCNIPWLPEMIKNRFFFFLKIRIIHERKGSKFPNLGYANKVTALTLNFSFILNAFVAPSAGSLHIGRKQK